MTSFSKEPSVVLQELLEGNQRFQQGEMLHPNLGKERLEKVREAQTPKATILSCSDSRVPPEILFDQGLGDLFVVRVAGNIAGPLLVDSLLFAVTSLKTPLVVVMGHQHCGAIEAALSGQGVATELRDLMPYLEPSVRKKTCLKEAVMANVTATVAFLSKIPQLQERVQSGSLHIQGAYFDFDSGSVELV